MSYILERIKKISTIKVIFFHRIYGAQPATLTAGLAMINVQLGIVAGAIEHAEPSVGAEIERHSEIAL